MLLRVTRIGEGNHQLPDQFGVFGVFGNCSLQIADDFAMTVE